MSADEEPDDPTRALDSKDSMADADSGRPIVANFLKVKRGMPRIFFHHRESPVRQPLNFLRQRAIKSPIIRRRAMDHNSVVSPAS